MSKYNFVKYDRQRNVADKYKSFISVKNNMILLSKRMKEEKGLWNRFNSIDVYMDTATKAIKINFFRDKKAGTFKYVYQASVPKLTDKYPQIIGRYYAEDIVWNEKGNSVILPIANVKP